MVDPPKIVIIINLPPPTIVKKLITTLGHSRYYHKFINGYSELTATMEKLMKKDVNFQWTEQCQEILDVLKNTTVTMDILVFLDWKMEFHEHFNASYVALSVVLVHIGEGSMDHPFSFARSKLSTIEKNCTMNERERLAMV